MTGPAFDRTDPCAPIIVTAQLGAEDAAWATALRRQYFPPERNHLDAHLTLFHHLPPSLEGELRALLAGLAAGPAPQARLGGVYSLGCGVALHVESDELMDLRSIIADRFSAHLTPQDRARPRLHITVQNKVDPALARQTLATLQADIRPRPLRVTGLACWHYLGGPWSPIATSRFRGRAGGS